MFNQKNMNKNMFRGLQLQFVNQFVKKRPLVGTMVRRDGGWLC